MDMQKTPEELNNLINQYGNDLYRFCVHLTRNYYEADDLYQDTFLKAIQLSHNLDCSGNIKSYLMGIAINLWKNRIRKNKRRNEIVPQTDFDSLEWGIGAESLDPLEKCLDSEIKRLLYDAVNKLPEKHRMVVLLHYTQNYTASEIAKILHIPRGTVLSRLAKSREFFLEQKGFEVGLVGSVSLAHEALNKLCDLALDIHIFALFLLFIALARTADGVGTAGNIPQ